MKIKTLIFFAIIAVFISGCTTEELSEEKDSDWLTYENRDLGISFKYPSNFKVYQQDENNLRVESDYKHPTSSSVSIGMNIKKINEKPETIDQIEGRLRPSGWTIISRENKSNYELIETSERQFYLLYDKGTLYIGDSIDAYKLTNFGSEVEEVVISRGYREKFNEIRNSIKII